MTCPQPSQIIQQIVRGPSTAVITLTHCDNDQYLYLDVNFTPARLGAAVEVQGKIWIRGQKGPKEVTSKVRFFDDGTVVGYGNTANGVRFWIKDFDFRRAHEASIWSSVA